MQTTEHLINANFNIDKEFVVINSAKYDADNFGKATLTTCSENELSELGFDNDDIKKISQLNIGGVKNDFDLDSVIVVRMV